MQRMGSAFFPCVCPKTQAIFVSATNSGSHHPSTFFTGPGPFGQGAGETLPSTYRAPVLKLQYTIELHGSFVKTQIISPHPRSFWFSNFWVRPKNLHLQESGQCCCHWSEDPHFERTHFCRENAEPNPNIGFGLAGLLSYINPPRALKLLTIFS